MAALNFPLNPNDNDTYEGYIYDATAGVWNTRSTIAESIIFSETAPSNPQEGTLWFDTTAAKMYVYYNDGTSSQWVSTVGGLANQPGTTGQMLIHDGTEWVATDGKSRNLIYNGEMQVAQRGTSETGITSAGYYTADRWSTFVNLGTYTQTVEADGPTGSGFTKSLKLECTTSGSLAAGSNVNVRQFLEGQDLQALKKGTSSAESLTLSFWVKSNVTGTYRVTLFDNDNSRQVGATYSISASGTWEKKTILLPPDTTGALDNDNANSLSVQFYLVAGTNLTSGAVPTTWEAFSVADLAAGLNVSLASATSNYWQVTGVQLETGTVATPFEHKPYGVELAECQRYYNRIIQTDDDPICVGGYFNSTDVRGTVNIPEMRVAPTLIADTGTNFYSFIRNGGTDTFNSLELTRSGPSAVAFRNATEVSGSAGHAGQIRANSSGATNVAFDAEL